MTLRLLILGTGGMAANHAQAFAAIPGVSLVAGVDTRPEPLAAFARRHGLARTFSRLEDALDWGQFDAVTNVTPDAAHLATTLPVLAAGKHILCEKPLATRAEDARLMADAAARAGVVNMVNLSYRSGPALQKAAKMVADGAIGRVRHFEASYLQSWLTQPAWGDWKTEPQWLWRLSTAHGSKGVLGDVGIHILDFATFAAGQDATDVSARLATFDKAPGNQIGEYVLDANDSATLQLRLSGGAIGVVHATRLATGHLNDLSLRMFGEKGGLRVGFERGQSTLSACMGDDVATAIWQPVECPPVLTLYQQFAAAIRGEGPGDPNFARGATLQGLLDAAEASAARQGLSHSL